MSNVIDITQRISDLVAEIPIHTLAQHGGPDALEVKIQDLIFEREDDAPKKRGRPKGSKNKPKDTQIDPPTEPKERGRPKKIPTPTPDEPKKRGRPKKTPTPTPDEPEKRGPGRPKGSKNKPKGPENVSSTPHPTKRGRGRPPKNPQ
jgi:hypothetical protein